MRKIINSLFRGLRTADNIIEGRGETAAENLIDNVQQIEQNNLYSALLKGELTDEVKEARHNLYAVDREADRFSYVAEGITKKKKTKKNRDLRISVENPTDMEILLVQENKLITQSKIDAMDDVDENTYKVNTAAYSGDYILKIERDYYPKFRIEEFTTKLVVKNMPENYVELNFYVSKYAKRFEPRSGLFLREMLRIIEENNIKSHIVNFDRLWFITEKAYGSDDLFEFSYKNIKYFETTEFDGNYVLKFIAEVETDGIDLTKQYFNESAAKKYEEKAPKQNNSIAFIMEEESNNKLNENEIKEMKEKIKKYNKK
jgi:hypothetical protein